MTPRLDVAWIDLEGASEALSKTMAERPFSRYLIAQGSIDEVVGVVHTRDLLVHLMATGELALADSTQAALLVPETLPIFDLLEAFREAGSHFAAVIDEYGGVEGIVTMSDIVEELIGEIADQEPADEPAVVARSDGSLLADGLLDI